MRAAYALQGCISNWLGWRWRDAQPSHLGAPRPAATSRPPASEPNLLGSRQPLNRMNRKHRMGWIAPLARRALYCPCCSSRLMLPACAGIGCMITAPPCYPRWGSAFPGMGTPARWDGCAGASGAAISGWWGFCLIAGGAGRECWFPHRETDGLHGLYCLRKRVRIPHGHAAVIGDETRKHPLFPRGMGRSGK